MVCIPNGNCIQRFMLIAPVVFEFGGEKDLDDRHPCLTKSVDLYI